MYGGVIQYCIFFITATAHSLVASTVSIIASSVAVGTWVLPQVSSAPHMSLYGGNGWDLCLLWSLTHSHFRSLFLTRESPGPRPHPCQLLRLASPGNRLDNPGMASQGLASDCGANLCWLHGFSWVTSSTLLPAAFPPFSLGTHRPL